MTTITFTLDQNNNLVGIDNATGFPQSIPLTVEGLKKVQTILHSTDEAARAEYYRRWNAEYGAREEERKQYEAERKQRQVDELGELF